MMWVLKHVYNLRQARNVLRYYLPRLSPPSLGAWLLSEIRDIFGPSLQLTLCSTSTFIWLQSRLDILLGSVAQKNALLRSDCFNETLPLIFWDGIAWLVGVNAHIYLTLYIMAVQVVEFQNGGSCLVMISISGTYFFF